jgi:hypothetical protein
LRESHFRRGVQVKAIADAPMIAERLDHAQHRPTSANTGYHERPH